MSRVYENPLVSLNKAGPGWLLTPYFCAGGRLTSHDNTQWERQLRCPTDPSRRHFKNDISRKRKISVLQTMGISYCPYCDALFVMTCVYFSDLKKFWDLGDFFWAPKTRQFSVNFRAAAASLSPSRLGEEEEAAGDEDDQELGWSSY